MVSDIVGKLSQGAGGGVDLQQGVGVVHRGQAVTAGVLRVQVEVVEAVVVVVIRLARGPRADLGPTAGLWEATSVGVW